VVVVDSATGRILSILNQRLALSLGFQPCSTFKVPVALAALNEKVIEPDSAIILADMKMNLTYALAHSNNYFFASLGRELGFGKLSYYAHQFGYGEMAGWNVAGEQAGHFPLAPPENGGVGMLASFGEEISQTPLQLAALMSAIANGGTLYCLQYPLGGQDAVLFRPKVKRKLNMELPIYGVIPGLMGAVERGTARGARQEEPIAGKTGTCSEDHAHLGWFGAFNIVGRRLVVVVLLRGGRPASGPRAASITGEIYRQLRMENYLTSPPLFHPIVPPISPRSASAFGEVLIILSPVALLIFIFVWRRLRRQKG
jgi:cell division protein FtsI/penicillin-binding protein 2